VGSPFDYYNDGCTDLFFVNGASLSELVKAGARYHNRLLRNDSHEALADVTGAAGLSGEGYGMARRQGILITTGASFARNLGRHVFPIHSLLTIDKAKGQAWTF